jgi:hypothetical protein
MRHLQFLESQPTWESFLIFKVGGWIKRLIDSLHTWTIQASSESEVRAVVFFEWKWKRNRAGFAPVCCLLLLSCIDGDGDERRQSTDRLDGCRLCCCGFTSLRGYREYVPYLLTRKFGNPKWAGTRISPSFSLTCSRFGSRQYYCSAYPPHNIS